MSTSIFANSGTEVQLLKDQLALSTTAKILTGTDDPRSVAKNAPKGSVYLQTGASGGKVFKKNDDGSSTNWVEVGAGAGGINYIQNPDGEAGTTGWATYADAAGTVPVDGTGGSANVTFTTTSSSPLRGTNSLLITKDAANRQGQGASYAFSIDSADKSEVIAVEFDYAIASGTFAAGDSSDLRVFVYDVTNSQLITPVAHTIQSNTQSKYKGLFQSNSNSTSYRLILHVATTSTSAWTFKLDNVRVGPQSGLFGAVVTDEKDYSSLVSVPACYGTAVDVEYFGQRVGNKFRARGVFQCGTTTGADATWFLPPGLSVDSSYFIQNASDPTRDGRHMVGTAHVLLNTPTVVDVGTTFIIFYDKELGGLYLTNTTEGTRELDVRATSGFINNDEVITFQFEVPISGWTTQVQMSDNADTRVISAGASGETSTIGSGNIIVHDTLDYDTHGAYSVSTGQFTVPVSGYYQVETYMVSASSGYTVSVYKNASPVKNFCFTDAASGRASGSVTIFCNPGDLLDIRPNASTGAIDPQSWVTFKRVSGPASIAANELVAVKAKRTTAQSVANATDTVIVFNAEDIDTHGAYDTSTGVFTAPVAGTYCVSATIGFAPSVANNQYAFFEKNSAAAGALINATMFNGASQETAMCPNGLIKLNPGDTVRLKAQQNSGGALDTATTAFGGISLSIHRVGF